MCQYSEYTIRDLTGNDAVESIEVADAAGGGFADEVADEMSEHFGYGRNDDFTPEEEQEMYELFGRPRATTTDDGDRTPPAGAMPVPVRLAA